jgi:2-dehydro-3-deoxyphosphogluconate aldolase/(4S)-4-hydroxy-2-oxoglutarate aldolase
MTKEEIRARIVEIGIIPAVRLYSESEALFAAEAVCGGGIPIVEVTMTIPGAVRIIGELTRHNTGVIVGAGTLCDVETAVRCLDAGAGFLTSPGLDLEIVEFALKQGVNKA